MTVNEIVGELRATGPRASDALRLNVLTLASQPVPRPATLRDHLRSRQRFVLLVPAAAALAVASAVAIGVTRSGSPDELQATAPAPETVQRSSTNGAELAAPAPPFAADAAGAQKTAPGPSTGRAQRYSATLALQVPDTDALSDATQRALAIARDLGGYVVSVHYATGDDGAASMTLRVPSTRAADAVTRLSSLGTILAQDVQIDDLQESLDGIDKQLERVRARIAALQAAIERAGSDAERARLSEQRTHAQSELRNLRRSRSGTAAEARTATIQLELRTKQQSDVVPAGSRLDRALDKALAVLAWEAVAVLAIGLVLAPFALVAAAVWATRRTRRRREEDRLLAAS